LGFIGPTLLLFLPWSVLLIKKRLEPQIPGRTAVNAKLFAYAWITLIAFSGLTGRVRFILPLWGGIAVAMAAVFVRLEEGRGRMFRFFWGGFLLVVAVVQTQACFWIFRDIFSGMEVVSGRQSREEYLRSPHGSAYANPSQGAFDYLRDLNPLPKGKIYLIGEVRSFRSPLVPYANTVYDLPLYVKGFMQGDTPLVFLDFLRREGFDFILVNPGEMERNVSGIYRSGAPANFLKEVLRLGSPAAYADPWCRLYRVKPLPC
jgi:hypothetical protein